MAATSLIKVTFSLTLLRVVSRNIFPYATFTIYIIIAVVIIQAIVFFFYTLFSCKPVQYLWLQLDPTQKGKSCLKFCDLGSLNRFANGEDRTLSIPRHGDFDCSRRSDILLRYHISNHGWLPNLQPSTWPKDENCFGVVIGSRFHVYFESSFSQNLQTRS